MSGIQAEALLQAKGEPWTFLVRESLSQPGDFVLSVLSDQPKAGVGSPLKVTHIKVMCEVRQLCNRGGCILQGSWLCLWLRLGCGRASLGFDRECMERGLGPEGWPCLAPPG